MVSSSFAFRSTSRIFLLLGLLCLAFGQVASPFEAGAAVLEACGQSCPGEEAGGSCDSLCDFCTCCSLAPQVPARLSLGAPNSPSVPCEPAAARTPLPPAPSGIMHVPKFSLA